LISSGWRAISAQRDTCQLGNMMPHNMRMVVVLPAPFDQQAEDLAGT
jgi:hypothetical protein